MAQMTPREARNIVLTGFMGTGKSDVGPVLAAALGWTFVDTDEVIVAGHGSIAEIFRTDGEAAFRAIERDLAQQLSEGSEQVIAVGGGMLLDPASRGWLTSNAEVVCLTAAPEVIVARVVADGVSSRPLLDVADPVAKVAELLAERTSHYEQFVQVATDNRNVDEVVADIVSLLGLA